jgi:hypothetical protein
VPLSLTLKKRTGYGTQVRSVDMRSVSHSATFPPSVPDPSPPLTASDVDPGNRKSLARRLCALNDKNLRRGNGWGC